MGDQTVAPGSVRVETGGLLTRRHRLMRGGTLLGELHLGLSITYTHATGRKIRMERPFPWRREVRLWEGDRVRAAARLHPFRPWMGVRFDETRCELQRAGRISPAWELVEEAVLLTIRRVSWRRAEIAVHIPLDGDLLAFSYYLVVTRWRARHRHRSAQS